MIRRVFNRVVVGLQANLLTVGVLVLVAVAVLGLVFARTTNLLPSTAPMNCADVVAHQVSGDMSKVDEAHSCFADSSRFAKMSPDDFRKFAQDNSPKEVQKIQYVGTVNGSDSNGPTGYRIAVYTLNDGYPDGAMLLYLDSNGKVIQIEGMG